MDRVAPAPAACRFSGKDRIVQPTLVLEFRRPIRQSAPHLRRYRVDDRSKLSFLFLDVSERLFQGHSRLVLLGDVHHRANKLTFVQLIPFGMTHDAQMVSRAKKERATAPEILRQVAAIRRATRSGRLPPEAARHA